MDSRPHDVTGARRADQTANAVAREGANLAGAIRIRQWCGVGVNLSRRPEASGGDPGIS